MELNKAQRVLHNLNQWQTDVCEEIETESDVRVFNAIGAMLQLINGGLMYLNRHNIFLTEVTNLNKEERAKACQIVANAYRENERNDDNE